MKRINMNSFLRGALLLGLPARLGGLFNLPQALLIPLGFFLAGYAAFVGVLASRERPPALLVWLVIVGNAAWVVQSVALALSDWVAPTALGYAFVLAQAVAVGLFAELQFIGVRRARPLEGAPA